MMIPDPGLMPEIHVHGVEGFFTWEVKIRAEGVRTPLVIHAVGTATTKRQAFKLARDYVARRCRRCGCSLMNGCIEGCHWVEPDLCSGCA